MKKSYNVFFLVMCLIQSTKALSSDQNAFEKSNNAFTEVILAEKERNIHGAVQAVDGFKKNPMHPAYYDAYIASSSFFNKLKLSALYYVNPKAYVDTISPVRHFPKVAKKFASNPDYKVTKEDIKEEDAYQLTTEKNDSRVMTSHGQTTFAKDLIYNIVAKYMPRDFSFFCSEEELQDKSIHIQSYKFSSSNKGVFFYSKDNNSFYPAISLTSASETIQGVSYITESEASKKMKSNYGFGSQTLYKQNPYMPNMQVEAKTYKSESENPLHLSNPVNIGYFQKRCPKLSFIYCHQEEAEKNIEEIIKKNIQLSQSMAQKQNQESYAIIINKDKERFKKQDEIVKAYSSRPKEKLDISGIVNDKSEKDYTSLLDRIAQ